jgi:hypothetical protein
MAALPPPDPASAPISADEDIRNPLLHLGGSTGIDDVAGRPSSLEGLQTTACPALDDALQPCPPIPMKRAVSDPTTTTEKLHAIDTVIDSPSRSHDATVFPVKTGALTETSAPSITAITAIRKEQALLMGAEAASALPGGGGQLYLSEAVATLRSLNNDLLAHQLKNSAVGREVRSASLTRSISAQHYTNNFALQQGRYPHLHTYTPHRNNSPSLPLDALINIEDVFKWMNEVIGGMTTDNAVPDLEAGLVPAIAQVPSPLISQDFGKDVIETFNCSICFENRAKADAFRLASCTHNHTYCLPCMSSYYTIQVTGE